MMIHMTVCLTFIGMDPAGPKFITNLDRTVGLWYDCAEFVDVIHTTNSMGSTPNPGGENITLGHQVRIIHEAIQIVSKCIISHI